MDEKRNRDLEDVMRKETGRGRRPVDLETRRKRDEILTGMRKLLMIGTEKNLSGLCGPTDCATGHLSLWRRCGLGASTDLSDDPLKGLRSSFAFLRRKGPRCFSIMSVSCSAAFSSRSSRFIPASSLL